MKIHGKLELVYLAFVPYVLCYEIVSAVIVPERRQHHSCLQYHLHDSRVLAVGNAGLGHSPPVMSTKIVVRCGDVTANMSQHPPFSWSTLFDMWVSSSF